jgi:hypothetical protein
MNNFSTLDSAEKYAKSQVTSSEEKIEVVNLVRIWWSKFNGIDEDSMYSLISEAQYICAFDNDLIGDCCD